MNYLKNALISFTILFVIAGISIGLYYLREVTAWSVILVLFIGLLFINIISSLIIFIQNRNIMAKLSWLLIINIFPFVGVLSFYVFGQRYSNRKSYQKYLDNKFIKEDQNELKNMNDLPKPLLEASKMTSRGIYRSNFEFYQASGTAMNKLFEDMRQAKKTIHIHFYILKPGEIYEEFKTILIQKAKEGIKIRFILDDFGRWGLPNYQINELIKKGIKIAVFGRVHFPFIGSENGYRTHRKMVIIDDKVVHTGGLNIANEYASLSKKYGFWIDLQGRITGDFVKSQVQLFMHDWFDLTKESLTFSGKTKNKIGNSFATLVEDTPENKENILESALIRLISGAKKEIHLATPYFIPSKIILSTLKASLLSGVKIHIYIPGRPDKKLVYLATKFNADKLQKLGLVIHQMNNMLIHSKVGLFDDEYAYFGTPNIDIRSLYSNLESMNVFTGKDIPQIKKLFMDYQKMSQIIPLKGYEESYIREKLLRIIINLLSPVM